MKTQSHPATPSHGTEVIRVSTVSGPALTPVQTVVAIVCLVLLLWVAIRIGAVILRLVVGLLFLGFLLYGVWYLFIK
jgi:hypothetical protein